MRVGGKEGTGKQPERNSPFEQLRRQAAANLPGSGLREIQEALSKLPEGKRIALTMRKEVYGEQFQGPFPHPEHAERYEAICRGFLERCLTLAETAQAANITIAGRKLDNEQQWIAGKNLQIEAQIKRDRQDSDDTKRGQYLGFLVLAALIAAAVFLAWTEHETTACILFGAAALAVIGKVFATKFSVLSKTENS